MVKIRLHREPEWNSRRIVAALARSFDWFRHPMLTEVYVDGGLADVLFVSVAGYATEIEIKISRADWNADQYKDKWNKERKYVKYFYYAVPEELAEDIPEWVPDWAGVIALYPERGQMYYITGEARYTGVDRIRYVRQAKAQKAEKLPKSYIDQMYRSCYFRFWPAELRRIAALQKAKYEKT